jgi:DNA-binding transcriptional MocR family regulator
MAPGLRVGFVVVPTQLVRTFGELSCMTNWMSPPLLSEIALMWIGDGQADRLLKWHRQQARVRQEIVHKALVDYIGVGSPLCYHLWVHLPEQWRMDASAGTDMGAGRDR